MEYDFGSYGVQVKVGAGVSQTGFECDFPLVGSNVKPSNEFCNVFGRNLGCLNHKDHVGKVVGDVVAGQRDLGGKVSAGMAVVRPSAQHCSDPLCPVCCYGWAKKRARDVMDRFEVFREVFPGFEERHLTVSIPQHDWDKSYKFLKVQAIAFTEAVGVVGSVFIFHSRRENKVTRSWYYSPHFHFVGFVKDGYVDGLLVRDIHNLTGYVLRNFERRKSLVGTILYQLSHAGIPSGRTPALGWCGELNYRKKVNPELLQLVKANQLQRKLEEKARRVCPVCGRALVHVCRVAKAGVFDYRGYEDKFVFDCVDNWVEVPEIRRRKRFSDEEEDAYAAYAGSSDLG